MRKVLRLAGEARRRKVLNSVSLQDPSDRYIGNHVFLRSMKPTTHTRLDLGLGLAHYRGKLPERLVDTGGLAKKVRTTHRIGLTKRKRTSIPPSRNGLGLPYDSGTGNKW
jgi:hypothetical protein